MTRTIKELEPIHLDVLKEIGNIGAGNAVTALSKLLNRKVDMTVPKVQILGFDKVPDLIGGAENLAVGILLRVSGDIAGYILFVFEVRYAYMLVNILMEKDYSDISELGELELSALKEIGNILTSSFLSSLAALTNLRILPSIPMLTIDMAGAILSAPAIEFGKSGDTVLFIETQFNEHERNIIGDFFIIPDVESYDVLLRALGVVS